MAGVTAVTASTVTQRVTTRHTADSQLLATREGAEPVAVTRLPAPVHPHDPQPGATPQRLESPIALVDALHDLLDRCSTAVWAGQPADEVRAQLQRLSRAVARLGAHQVAGARVLETVPPAGASAATSTGALLAADFGGDRRAGDALVRTGAALQKARASATEQALERGEISTTQASIIAAALAALPDDVDDSDRRRCEGMLLRDAARLSVRDLRRRGDRIYDLLAPPQEVDATEQAIVHARELRAWRRTELVMRDNADGTWSGRFTVPELAAQMLRTALEAHSAPRRRHLGPADPGLTRPAASDRGTDGAEGAASGEPELSYPQRLGRALCALVEHLPTDGFARSGGSAALVAISLDLETLVRQTGCGTTTEGARVSAAEVRRLACEHGLIPQVLGGGSLPLDLGRRQRLFSTAQRLALAQRDLGCAFPGCDRPPSWCEAHHAGEPWARGGRTDVSEGVLLCSFHHHRVHEDAWSIRFHPDDGIPEFRRRPVGGPRPVTDQDDAAMDFRHRPQRDGASRARPDGQGGASQAWRDGQSGANRARLGAQGATRSGAASSIQPPEVTDERGLRWRRNSRYRPPPRHGRDAVEQGDPDQVGNDGGQ